jgi:hypothetical protein
VQGFRKVEVCPPIERRDAREHYRQPRKKERRAHSASDQPVWRAAAVNVSSKSDNPGVDSCINDGLAGG